MYQNPQPGYQQPYAAPQFPGQQYPAPQYVQLPKPSPGEPFDGAAHPNDLSRPLYSANIGQAIARFFKNYAVFSGRASRSEYWWSTLALIGAWVVVGTISGIVEEMSYSSAYGFGMLGSVMGLVIGIAYLGIIIPSLAIMWRRLHDANLAGLFFFLTFIPFFGQIALIVLLALPPKVEGRRFVSNV